MSLQENLPRYERKKRSKLDRADGIGEQAVQTRALSAALLATDHPDELLRIADGDMALVYAVLDRQPRRSRVLDRAAYPWNLSRSAIYLPAPGTVVTIKGWPLGLPAYVERVLATVIGLWVEQCDDSCKPERGDHADQCPNRLNRLVATAHELALGTYGRADGGYLEQTKKAMVILAETTMRATRTVPVGNLSSIKGILEYEALDGTKLTGLPKGGRAFVIAFAPFFDKEIMKGHYVYIPTKVVQQLTSTLEWKLYRELVCAAGTFRVVSGEFPSTEYAITGPDASIPPWRLGIGEFTSPREIEGMVAVAIKHINTLQKDYQWKQLPRADEHGLKISIRYMKGSSEKVNPSSRKVN